MSGEVPQEPAKPETLHRSLDGDFLASVFQFKVPCFGSCQMLIFFFRLIGESPLILFQTARKINIWVS